MAPKITVFPTPDDVLAALEGLFVETMQQAIKDRGRFTVSLSGGNSPKRLYELLAASSVDNQLDWTKVFFFFGDERYVPKTDAQSNFLMAEQALFVPLNIHPSHVFAVDTSLEVESAAAAYNDTINSFFNNEEVIFDLVLLGLGDNSHTASLFPHTPVLKDELPGVKSVFLEDQKVFRITMNAPMINNARQVAFLVYGADKAIAVHHVLEDKRNIDEYPAQLIAPANGRLQWFLDDAAAANISLNR